MKKWIALLLALVMVFTMAACAGDKDAATTQDGESTNTPEEPSTDDTSDTGSEQTDGEDIYISVIAKGWQHQFWQTAQKGAEDAAAKYGVTINFQGPPTEADIDKQVEMLKSELTKNPQAVCLAALSTDAVMTELQECVDKGIPVIGFDSGVPNAPEGAIYATASTDNSAAAMIAADKLAENEDLAAAMKAATPENPVVIGLLAQDVTSESITSRSKGFLSRMKELAEEIQPGKVSIEGHEMYNDEVADAAIILKVQVASTANVEDVTNAAQALLNTQGLKAVFVSNEGAVTGFLAATTDGSDLADGGKYEDLLVVGFDAGQTQKNAVREGWFYGSITQDPYQIGYQAVELAYKAYTGETVSDVDTGAKWYDASNIDDPDIAQLVYD